MNCSAKLRVAAALMTVAVAGTLALTSGCSSVAADVEMAPTTYVAVAPLDLADDYIGHATVYVAVAPLDLPDDYYTRATSDSASADVEDIVVARANSWMTP